MGRTDYTKLKKPLMGRGASYSTLRYLERGKCLAPLGFSKVQRLRAVYSNASERGTTIHLKGEGYLKGDIPQPTKEYKGFKDEMKELKRLGAVAELEMALDVNWEPCDYDQYNKTGKVMYRAKLDASVVVEEDDSHVMYIIDYKTGKVYDDHEKQANDYAACAYEHFPEVDKFVVEFWYLDQNTLGDSPFEYSRSAAKKLSQTLMKRCVKFAGLSQTQLKKRTASEKNCARCVWRSDKQLEDGSDGPCDGWKKIR